MKTPLMYGLFSALAIAVLTLLLYFGGLHDSPEKMGTAQLVGGLLGFLIGVTFQVLAVREKRHARPANEPWGYGSAFGAAALTGIFGAVFGAIFAYFYFKMINPSMSEFILQAELAKLEAKGLSSDQVAQAEGPIRMFTSPGMISVMQLIMGAIWSCIIALIVAIFFRNRPAATPPPVSA